MSPLWEGPALVEPAPKTVDSWRVCPSIPRHQYLPLSSHRHNHLCHRAYQHDLGPAGNRQRQLARAPPSKYWLPPIGAICSQRHGELSRVRDPQAAKCQQLNTVTEFSTRKPPIDLPTDPMDGTSSMLQSYHISYPSIDAAMNISIGSRYREGHLLE